MNGGCLSGGVGGIFESQMHCHNTSALRNLESPNDRWLTLASPIKVAGMCRVAEVERLRCGLCFFRAKLD